MSFKSSGNGQRAFTGPAPTVPAGSTTPTKDDYIIAFGKFKGQGVTFRDLLTIQPDYLIWIWEQHSNGKNLITEELADKAYAKVRELK